MAKGKVLFVNQEITPYVEETEISYIGRYLPQKVQEQGKEIRTFMPKYGTINERKNQLHEVIRLSGVNVIIDETDHPLIIKVASIQSARMQIYFIDNEDFFHKRNPAYDDKGVFFADNDERMIFFSRGVLETVKKLAWQPDIIHCHGWFAALLPFYVKASAYHDDPTFSETKIVISIYDEEFPDKFAPSFDKKLKADAFNSKSNKYFKDADYLNLMKAAIALSDGVVLGSEKVNEELLAFAKKQKKPILPYSPFEELPQKVNAFYDTLIPSED